MKKVKITAIRKVQYDDLMAKYENPIEHTCDVCEGHSWVSEDGKCPDGLYGTHEVNNSFLSVSARDHCP